MSAAMEVGALPAQQTSGLLARARGAVGLDWLGNPSAYAVGALLCSLLSLGVTLIAPRLLDPAAFGAFALLSSLFQYGGKTDLGLSQLADREVALQADVPAERAEEILRALWVIGGGALVLAVPLGALLSFESGTLPLAATILAIGGGVVGMISNGPVTIYRARSQVWEFTVLALVLHSGMIAPRLVGLTWGGVTGCFALLALWYLMCAVLFARPTAWRPLSAAFVLPLVRKAFPFFVFNVLWMVYLTANRWIASYLSTPSELGLFAFGASLALVGLGLLSTLAQVRYPRILGAMADTSRKEKSGMMEREILMITVGMAAVALAAVWLAPLMIALLFPGYGGSAPGTVAFAISCIPLGAITWIMPMMIVLSQRPARDAVMLLAPFLVVLAGAMVAGGRMDGITGQAWACAASALALLFGTAAMLCRMRILTGAAALRVAGLQAALVVGLSVVALSFGPAHATSRAADGQAGPPAGWPLAFEENFDKVDLWLAGKGRWEPHYPDGWRTNVGNQEQQYYVDPRPGRDPEGIARLAPYSVQDGVLTIRAQPLPEALRPAANGLRYASGMLTTHKSFAMTYGYVEMRARVPKGKGVWPALWLLPAGGGWPPEIDVMEVLGHDTRALWVTLHTEADGRRTHAQREVPVPDLSEGFHVYAMKWTPEAVTWYFDGREVFATPTPKDMHKPMFLLVNLAVGGKWPGSPDASTAFPADFRIDWIRAYAAPSDIQQPRG